MRCVNEALANMLIHNDWTVAEPKVDLYMPRLVLTSYGGLPRGMTKREFYCGVSRPRNPGLAMVFSCLGLTGQRGRGVPTIVRKYGKKAFKIHEDHIDVIIPVNPEFWNRPTLREIFIGELETEIMVWIFMLAPMALIVLVGAVLLLLLEILLKTLF
jgi:predicted HTH transcriptional regulator